MSFKYLVQSVLLIAVFASAFALLPLRKWLTAPVYSPAQKSARADGLSGMSPTLAPIPAPAVETAAVPFRAANPLPGQGNSAAAERDSNPPHVEPQQQEIKPLPPKLELPAAAPVPVVANSPPPATEPSPLKPPVEAQTSAPTKRSAPLGDQVAIGAKLPILQATYNAQTIADLLDKDLGVLVAEDAESHKRYRICAKQSPWNWSQVEIVPAIKEREVEARISNRCFRLNSAELRASVQSLQSAFRRQMSKEAKVDFFFHPVAGWDAEISRAQLKAVQVCLPDALAPEEILSVETRGRLVATPRPEFLITQVNYKGQRHEYKAAQGGVTQ